MPYFEQLPAILRVLIVFAVILAAIKKRVSLGNAFFFGALLMGWMFGLGPVSMLRVVFSALTDPKTASLSAIVSLILVFSHSMELGGQMERLLERFKGLVVHPKINLVVFPALIGLLPMPGGAIFSAPMVKSLGQRMELSGSQLSYINYWFRHIWEYWWPLYPGVLLATTLARIDIWVFVLFLFPLTTVALFVGYWPLKVLNGRTKTQRDPHPCLSWATVLPFVSELAPILLVIGLGLGLGVVLSFFLSSYGWTVTKELGLIIALIFAILWVWRRNRLSLLQRRQILTQPQLLGMIYMVAAILVFKEMLEGSLAVEAISRELLEWRVPLMSITVILPFLVGGIVGITIAFVGTTFPILISLIHAFGETRFMLPYMMLALASGFVGVLLSPLHLCLLLSNEYFGTSLGPVYKHLWLPCIVLLLTGCVYFLVLHSFLGT